MMEISPLAPDNFPDLEVVSGVQFATRPVGIKYPDRNDVMLARLSPGTTVAGVFTISKTAGAPVLLCRNHLASGQGQARALIVNSGNANAFTGRLGSQQCQATCEGVASALGCSNQEVFVASTGVIGEPLPIEKILDSIPDLSSNMDAGWQDAAQAIMTTDTFPKGSTIISRIGDSEVRISGFAKGSGMIEPDMATMLAFIFTDADISSEVLQQVLEEANHDSFNAITVDSDTSTSDSCMLFATAKADNLRPSSIEDQMLLKFKADLLLLMQDLSIQVVRDGEGASKLIEIAVEGAENDHAARVIGKSIANSPLVKTAIAGEDANWGRIVMAVGKSGEQADRDKLNISIGDIQITENGQVLEGYDESQVTNHLKGKEVGIKVDVGVGSGCSRVWTCDLTHGYITINADYRS